MSWKKIIKEKIRYFFFSNFIKNYFKKKSFHSNPQANWIGEILINEVSKNDKFFFKKSLLESRLLTINGVTKSVGIIKGNTKIDISDIDTSKNKIQFSFYSRFWEKNSVLKIKINDNQYNFKNIKNIDNPIYTPENWFDIALDINENLESLEITCNNKNEIIYFAKPITFNSVNKNIEINQKKKDHIIVIVLDGVVADFLHNNENNNFRGICISPNINEFFRDHFSTKFSFSTCEWSLPAVSSFFSGMYTSRHKIFSPSQYNYFNNELPSLPEILNINGYKTQFFSTTGRVTPLFGFQRGFDRYFYSHPYGFTKIKFNTNDWINNLIDFLNIYQNDKTFSYLHFPNTHQEWMLQGFNNYSFSLLRNDNLGFDLREIEKYDAENIEKLRIYELDLFLESLFHFINKKLNDSATVILTGDHGSPFFSKYSKSGDLTNDNRPTLNYRRTNTPFLCKVPISKEKTYYKNKDQLVSSNLDLSKTILDICNIKTENFNSGVSIFDNNRRSYVISESIYKNLLEIAVIDKDFSYFKQFKFDERNFKFEDSSCKTMLYKTKNEYNKNLIEEHIDIVKKFESIIDYHIKENF